MKIRKNQKGFTLVEVIVVAVIVAVLAAVAVPLYLGYVRDSRTNVCQNNAGTIAGALAAANAKGMTPAAGWYVAGVAPAVGVLTIPADPNVPGSVANTISLPSGYTLVGCGTGTITVTGPNGSTSTPVPY